MTPIILVLYGVCALGGALLATKPPATLRHVWILVGVALIHSLTLVGFRSAWGMAIALLGVVAWMYLNPTVPGIRWIGVGAILNTLMMVLHGGSMPIHTDVLASLDIPNEPGTMLLGTRTMVMALDSPLHWLSDWIPLSVGAIALFLSPGDLLVGWGLFRWLRGETR